jgi:hypothetical protein
VTASIAEFVRVGAGREGGWCVVLAVVLPTCESGCWFEVDAAEVVVVDVTTFVEVLVVTVVPLELPHPDSCTTSKSAVTPFARLPQAASTGRTLPLGCAVPGLCNGTLRARRRGVSRPLGGRLRG